LPVSIGERHGNSVAAAVACRTTDAGACRNPGASTALEATQDIDCPYKGFPAPEAR
jgi:hypothetical protein